MTVEQLLLKNKKVALFALFLLVLLIPTPAQAAILALSWDPNDSGFMSGFRCVRRYPNQNLGNLVDIEYQAHNFSIRTNNDCKIKF